MEIEKCFTKYLKYKSFHSSQGDYDFCLAHIRVLQEYFKEKGIIDTKELKETPIEDYIGYKTDKHNSKNTINKDLSVLRRCLKFNKIKVKGYSDFKELRYKKTSFQVLSLSQLKLILKHYRGYDKTDPIKFTNYLVFFLLLYTGVRRTELSYIKISELDLDNCCIYLNHSKTGKPRLVFFKEYLVQDILDYIALLPNREYLFYNFRSETRLTAEHISAVYKYLRIVTGIRKISPHVIRHTMATLLVENNASITSIQRLLGHASSKTTDIYLHMSVKKIKQTFDESFPNV